MKILGTSQKCLRFVGLGRERDVQIGSKSISRTSVRCLIIGGQITFAVIFVIILLHALSRGLYAIVFPLHSIFIVLIKLLIYVVLILKTDQIAEIIDYLQDIVVKRKFSMKC